MEKISDCITKNKLSDCSWKITYQTASLKKSSVSSWKINYQTASLKNYQIDSKTFSDWTKIHHIWLHDVDNGNDEDDDSTDPDATDSDMY